jgi:type IV pilus assembly protein PilC
LLIVMVIGLFIFLITFVVPRFAQLYDQLGTKLPAMTLFLLALGQGCAELWAVCRAGAGAVGLAWCGGQDGCGRDLIDRVRIKTAAAGNACG